MDNKDNTSLPTSLPTVDIVFPCRNRQDHLPTFLDCLYNLQYPKHLISIFTIINDSSDDSEKILQQFKKEHEHEYKRIYIKRYDLNTPTYDSNRYSIITPKIIQSKHGQRVTKQNETHKVYKNLAKHRNSLMAKADSAYIFSVDTDIMFDKDTLTRLLSYQKDYISQKICNGFIVEKLNGKRAYDYTNAMYYEPTTNTHVHYPYETTGIVECSNSGAIFLISKKAYQSGAKFAESPLGEDFPMSQDLIKRGFTLYCDMSNSAAHCMDLNLLEKYKRGEWEY
jgi:cellulose synthase/poly-beta-1,6-N-acetylglucosamine synthase-like glycosyltransferase